jgi:hypothetical protein
MSVLNAQLSLDLISQCDRSLNFSPRAPWPKHQPALAVNKLVIGGFEQQRALNHQIDPSDSPLWIDLLCSAHRDLSFSEVSKLIHLAHRHPAIPLEQCLIKWGWLPNDQFYAIAHQLERTPQEFQNWCADKRMGPMDLAPLLSIPAEALPLICQTILEARLSKAHGTQALELLTELHLLGRSIPSSSQSSEAWIAELKNLRHPETSRRDEVQKQKWAELPWPSLSQPRWIRRGDRSGIELKLFISHPHDLKKCLQSLSRIQELMENDEPSLGGTP